jgi:hypothetical protein
MALLCSHRPTRRRRIPNRRINASGEGDVTPDIEDCVDMREVATQFFVVGKPLAESPALIHFGDAELVEGKLAVDAGARVPVPIPDTAEVCAGFEGVDTET